MNKAIEDLLRAAFTELAEDIHKHKTEAGFKATTPADWDNSHEVPAVLMLIVTELAEAMEAFRDNDQIHFEEELADVFIRLLGLSSGLGMDLVGATLSKIKRNKARAFRHAGKCL